MATHPQPDIIARFEKFIDRRASGCWEWLGYINKYGYGSFWYRGRMRGAHRSYYEILNGPIAAGMEIDHLCRNTRCVNPAHLEAVTKLENIRRVPESVSAKRVAAMNEGQKSKTHCPRWHEYAGNNLRVYVTKSGGERRSCRTCHREYTLRQRYEKKTTRYKRRAETP